METLTLERELTVEDMEDSLLSIDKNLNVKILAEKSEHQNCGGGKSKCK